MSQELEDEKLRLEIQQLKKQWFRKPEFLSISINLFIGIATAGILYFNGAFDFKNLELKIEREKLEQDINKFTGQKKNLQKSNRDLALKVQELNGKIKKFQNDSAFLASNLNELKSTISTIEKGKYAKEKVLLDFIKKTNYYKHQVDSLIPYSYLPYYFNRRPRIWVRLEFYYKDEFQMITFDCSITSAQLFKNKPLVFRPQFQMGGEIVIALTNELYYVSGSDDKYKVKDGSFPIDLRWNLKDTTIKIPLSRKNASS